MRIIHDVDGPMQIGAGLTPLMGRNGKSVSARVEMLACVDPNFPIPWRDDEAIYIEGDAAAIVRMLEDWIEFIEIGAEDLVRDGKLDPGWRDFDKRWGPYSKHKKKTKKAKSKAKMKSKSKAKMKSKSKAKAKK